MPEERTPQQNTARRSLTPEQREARRAAIRRKKRRRKRLLAIMVAVLLAASCLAVGRLIYTSMRIESIVIAGDSPYTQEEITEALGIAVGDKMYGFDKKSVAAEGLTRLSYLSSLRIKRNIFGFVRISVTSRNASYGIYGGDKLFVLSDSMVLLDITEKGIVEEKLGLFLFSVSGLSYTEIGEKVTLSSANGFTLDSLGEILETFSSSALAEKTEMLTLNSRFDLQATCRGGALISFGSSDKIDAKIDAAATLLATLSDAEAANAVIDVSNPQKAIVKSQ